MSEPTPPPGPPDLLDLAKRIDALDLCEGYTLPDSELPALWEALSLARRIVRGLERKS